MKPSHLLAVHEIAAGDVTALLDRADRLKARRRSGGGDRPLAGKTLGLFFEKSSTRTRVSFETAMNQLGGNSLFLSLQDLQLKRGESIADTARVLSRYLDAIVIRTFGHDLLEEWAAAAAIPVINGLTDLHHPCQALGDLMTIRERFGTLKGLKLAYIGDGNNVAHSLIEAAAKTGIEIHLACPKGFEPDPLIVAASRIVAKQTGGTIEIGREPAKAAEDADVLYTDVWISMGQEKQAKAKLKKFKPYQINDTLLSVAKPSAVVMHCLPAHRGMEITADVLDGKQSVIWDQAENRLHIQKAILEWLLG
ncbi:MAG: ornithine carbamoyltransferase [Nitrospirae bacterium]|nr:ornithine carbamoyltransferase [Nitrospirota bacterium]